MLPTVDYNDLVKAIARETAVLLQSSLADDVLDATQAAKLLKLHPETVRQMAVAGEIPACRMGKTWRFRRSALLEHVTPSDWRREEKRTT